MMSWTFFFGSVLCLIIGWTAGQLWALTRPSAKPPIECACQPTELDKHA